MTAEEKRRDLHRAKVEISILTTCLVQTINESDPSFQERFLKKLRDAYHEFRDNTGGDVKEQMELLDWPRTFLKGFDHFNGQGKPFLSDNRTWASKPGSISGIRRNFDLPV